MDKFKANNRYKSALEVNDDPQVSESPTKAQRPLNNISFRDISFSQLNAVKPQQQQGNIVSQSMALQ